LAFPCWEMVNLVYVAAYAAGFLSIYDIALRLLNKYPARGLHNDPADKSTKYRAHSAASRFMGIAHSSTVAPLSILCLYYAWPNWNYTGPLSYIEERTIEITFAYFMADLVHFVLYEPDDYLLLVHHAICVGFFSHVSYLHKGGLAAMVAICTGEVTNPLQSSWFLAKLSGNKKLYGQLSGFFTTAFFILRVLILPPWAYFLIRDFFAGAQRGDITFGTAYGWSGTVLFMCLASWAWSYLICAGYRKFRAKQHKEAQSQTGQTGQTDAAAGKKAK